MSPVSIPVGFFQALQPRHPINWRAISRCFNPCRVFSGLATEISGLRTCARQRFNPCRVFSGLATKRRTNCTPERYPVSIPVGFFQALQLKVWCMGVMLISCFNPCRVFSGLATAELFEGPKGMQLFQSLSGFFRPCNGET